MKFSRDYYAHEIGTTRGNVTVIDAVAVCNQAHFVVRCACGRQWETPTTSFRKGAYSGRCSDTCTAQHTKRKPRSPSASFAARMEVRRSRARTLRAEGLSYTLIAERMGCSRQTAASLANGAP